MKVLAVSMFVLILTAPLPSQDDASERSRIIALEKAWNQAYKLRDKKALSEILSPSLVLVNDDGSLETQSAFLASVDTASPTDLQQSEPDTLSVQLFGDTAVATGIFRSVTLEHGKLSTKRNRFVDTWVKSKGAWVCVAASAITVLR